MDRKVLGSGAFGTVCISSDDVFSVEKVIYPYKDKRDNIKPNYGYSCLNEISIQQTLEHENIININSVKFRDDACIVITMPRCKREVDIDNIFDIKHGEKFIKDILSGLDYLDSRYIAHCDLKPNNILMFINDKQVWKNLLDAKDQESDSDSESSEESLLDSDYSARTCPGPNIDKHKLSHNGHDHVKHSLNLSDEYEYHERRNSNSYKDADDDDDDDDDDSDYKEEEEEEDDSSESTAESLGDSVYIKKIKEKMKEFKSKIVKEDPNLKKSLEEDEDEWEDVEDDDVDDDAYIEKNDNEDEDEEKKKMKKIKKDTFDMKKERSKSESKRSKSESKRSKSDSKRSKSDGSTNSSEALYELKDEADDTLEITYKICDFSAAQITTELADTFIGTRGYIAPESMFKNQKITPKVDIFALGCIMYEFITGTYLFEHDEKAYMVKLLGNPPNLQKNYPCITNTDGSKGIFMKRLNDEKDVSREKLLPTWWILMMKECLQIDKDKRPNAKMLLQKYFNKLDIYERIKPQGFDLIEKLWKLSSKDAVLNITGKECLQMLQMGWTGFKNIMVGIVAIYYACILKNNIKNKPVWDTNEIIMGCVSIAQQVIAREYCDVDYYFDMFDNKIAKLIKTRYDIEPLRLISLQQFILHEINYAIYPIDIQVMTSLPPLWKSTERVIGKW